MDISDWPRQIRDRYVHAPDGIPTDDVSKAAEEIAWFIEQAIAQHGGKMDQNIDITQNVEKLRALVQERGGRVERLERALRIVERYMSEDDTYEGAWINYPDKPKKSPASVVREALADDDAGRVTTTDASYSIGCEGTTPGMWEMVSDALDGEPLPESINRALHLLASGEARVYTAPPIVPESMTCPVCEKGTLTRVECCLCDTCEATPVLTDQIRRNDERLAAPPQHREALERLRDGRDVPMPHSKEHAEAMVTVGLRWLEDGGHRTAPLQHREALAKKLEGIAYAEPGKIEADLSQVAIDKHYWYHVQNTAMAACRVLATPQTAPYALEEQACRFEDLAEEERTQEAAEALRWAAKQLRIEGRHLTSPPTVPEAVRRLPDEWRRQHGIVGYGYATQLEAAISQHSEPGRTDELAMLVRRLAHSLRNARPGNELSRQAVDYLRRHGLEGSPMRSSESNEPAGEPGREDVKEKYHELLYEVATKHPGESRHETALRYIREAENRPTYCGYTPAPDTDEREDG